MTVPSLCSIVTFNMVRSSPPNTARSVNAGPDRHRPRIAAMERGPGPAKYKLPGTTGHTDHLISKRKQPAYSFGTKTKQFSTMNTNSCRWASELITFAAIYVSSVNSVGLIWGCQAGSDLSAHTLCSPGPIYFVSPSVTRSGREGAPKYSLLSRAKSHEKTNTPGPGQND